MSAILAPVLALTVLGVVFAALLGLLHRFFGVTPDPRVDAILSNLPGANCGACGFPGCQAAAEAIARGSAPANVCVPNPAENARAIASLMKQPLAERARQTARLHCAGGDRAADRYAYRGILSCAADTLLGGHKACSYGCLGHGDCLAVCAFGAIRMQGGLPVIDPARCTACGRCAAQCPKKLIEIAPAGTPACVRCASQDRGGAVRSVCPPGCIGCGVCARKAPALFRMDGNLALVRHEATDFSGLDEALASCPVRVIERV